MSNEIILHKSNSMIMEDDSVFGMANSQMGNLYLTSNSVEFVAGGGVLQFGLNMKTKKYISSDLVKQKQVSIPLEDIAGLECIVHKTIFKKYATMRVHLINGVVAFFSVGGSGKLEDTAQWLDAIRLQCTNIGLKRPYLKVNGELVN